MEYVNFSPGAYAKWAGVNSFVGIQVFALVWEIPGITVRAHKRALAENLKIADRSPL